MQALVQLHTRRNVGLTNAASQNVADPVGQGDCAGLTTNDDDAAKKTGIAKSGTETIITTESAPYKIATESTWRMGFVHPTISAKDSTLIWMLQYGECANLAKLEKTRVATSRGKLTTRQKTQTRIGNQNIDA